MDGAVMAESREAVRVFARARLHLEARAAFLRAVPAFVAATRAEPGCLAYDLLVSATDPLSVATVEHWADRDAMLAHLDAPHTRNFMALIAASASQQPEVRMIHAGREERLI